MKKLIIFAALCYILIGLFGHIVYLNSLAAFNGPNFINSSVPAIHFSFWLGLVYITILMGITIITAYLIIRHARKKGVKFNFKWLSFMFWLQLFTTSYFIFNELFAFLSPKYYVIWYASLGNIISSIGLAIITRVLYVNRARWFNFVVIFLAVGVATVLGIILSPILALILLAIFAVYDYIAVFVTKHMQMLVSALGDNLFPLMIVDGDLEFAKKRMAGLDQGLSCKNCGYFPIVLWTSPGNSYFECPICKRNGHKMADAKKYEIDFEGNKDFEDDERYKAFLRDKPMMLGSGDIIISGAVIGSLAVTNSSLLIFGIFGGVLGIIANMIWLKVSKKTLPALPLILMAMIFSLGLGLVV